MKLVNEEEEESEEIKQSKVKQDKLKQEEGEEEDTKKEIDLDEFNQLRMTASEQDQRTYEQRLEDILDSKDHSSSKHDLNSSHQDNQDESFVYDGKDVSLFESDDSFFDLSTDYATRLDEILQANSQSNSNLTLDKDLTNHQPNDLISSNFPSSSPSQNLTSPLHLGQTHHSDSIQNSLPLLSSDNKSNLNDQSSLHHSQPVTPLVVRSKHHSPTSSQSASISQHRRPAHQPNSLTPSPSVNGSNVSSNFWSGNRIRPPNTNFSRLRSLRPSPSTANSISSLQLPRQSRLSSSTLASDRFIQSHTPDQSIQSIFDPNISTSPSKLKNGNNSISSIMPIHDESNSYHQQSSNQSIFKWISLSKITQKIYPSSSPKKPSHQPINSRFHSFHSSTSNNLFGLPTTVAIGAVIVVGTARGWAIVFDYASNLKSILGSDAIAKDAGAVSALSISHDHTFVAVGHIMGHIHLYDLVKPNQPARTVTPTKLKLVQEGRAEGHLLGNRIIHINFVGLRRTAIVSADETGLAFYHALGQVLGLASTDVIRILGKYPDTPNGESNFPSIDSHNSSHHHTRHLSEFSINSSISAVNQPQKSRQPTKIFGLLPLSLGPSPHATDDYGLVAILTSSKLIIISLKPTPHTCWRAMRNASDPNQAGTFGSLSWFPSAKVQDTSSTKKNHKTQDGFPKSSKPSTSETHNGVGMHVDMGMDPLLAFSWGKTIRFMTTIPDLSEIQTSPLSSTPSILNHDHLLKDSFLKGFANKFNPVDLSKLRFVEGKSWVCASNVLAVQWLSWRIICVLTCTHFEVIDTQIWQRTGFESIDIRRVVRLNVSKEATSDSGQPINRPTSTTDSCDQTVGGSLVGSVKAYKGKIFLLTTDDLRLGVVTSWADQILELVEVGSLTEAIELTTSYWIGRPDLETIGLPSQDSIRKSVVRPKLIEIMHASLEYVFSDRRMEDDTHFDLEGRGVDRTGLFEGLVRSCTQACIEIHHLDFVLETMFEQYQEHGIETIFLLQLEPFILRSQIKAIPTAITQELISLHEKRKEFDLIDMIIRNVDPLCLDINQVLAICSRELLYDSLVYVYTEAMNDFIGPIVEFLGLIKTIHSHRRRMLQYCEDSNLINEDLVLFNSQNVNDSIEGLVPNAYKIFQYLSAIFCGFSYPNQIKYETSRGSRARSEVYRFIFSGQSMHWPQPDGKLILTTEEGQEEPTYPYLRTLLAFDSEAMLDCLDAGFEDSWLHDNLDRDREKSINRQLIINLLLEVVHADPEFLTPSDRTFVYIFIARNLPKYSQLLSLPSSILHSILISLSTDDDHSSTEDRQLAAEFLLSIYTPPFHQNGSEELLEFFRDAGFWRILNSIYTQREMWVEVVDTLLKSPDLDFRVFNQLSEIILNIVKPQKSTSIENVESQVFQVLLNSINRLVEIDVIDTAMLIEKFRPQSHLEVVESLTEDHNRFIYLQTLLEPSQNEQNEHLKHEVLTQRMDIAIPLRYIGLMSKLNPDRVIQYLKSNHSILDRGTSEIVQICRANQIFDALVWQLDQVGKTCAAFEELDIILKTQASLITKLMTSGTDSDRTLELHVDRLTRCALTAAEVCVERTDQGGDGLTGEDCWFYLLSSTIQCIQVCAPLLPATGSPPHQTISNLPNRSGLDSPSENQHRGIQSVDAIERLKELLPTIVSILISRTKFSNQISSSNLIRRLIESSSTNPGGNSSASNEFRSIILMIMETYQFEENVLHVTSRLIDEDLFEHVERLAKAKEKGIRPNELVCFKCHQPILMADRHQSWGEFRPIENPEFAEKEEEDDDGYGDRVLDNPSRNELIQKLGLPPKSISPIRQRSVKGKEVEQSFDYSSTCFSPSTFNNNNNNNNNNSNSNNNSNNNNNNVNTSQYSRNNSNNHQLFNLGGQGNMNLGDSFLNRGDPSPVFPPSPFLSGPPFRNSLTLNNLGPSTLSPTRKFQSSAGSPFFKADHKNEEHAAQSSPHRLDPSPSSFFSTPSNLIHHPESQDSHPPHNRNRRNRRVFDNQIRISMNNSHIQIDTDDDNDDQSNKDVEIDNRNGKTKQDSNKMKKKKEEIDFAQKDAYAQSKTDHKLLINRSNKLRNLKKPDTSNNPDYRDHFLKRGDYSTHPALVLLGHGRSFHYHCWFFSEASISSSGSASSHSSGSSSI